MKKITTQLPLNQILTIPVLLVFFALHSCTRYRDIVYLQQPEYEPDSINFYPYQVPDYQIQQRDVLYIRIISMNQEVTQVINASPVSGANLYSNDASFYIYGYNVSDSGEVELPVIGKVEVVGKTLEEAKQAIVDKTNKFLKEPTVIVKLLSFKYSVLGEVMRPGMYTNFNNQLNVLEAISQAGDVTPYGNRRRVMVVRPKVDGTHTYRFDLTSTEILKSEGFFLLPNDVVYVEPVKSRNFRNNIPTISLVLGSISTFVLVLNYFSR
jgi:polysaccharide biosynthesis/export protein